MRVETLILNATGLHRAHAGVKRTWLSYILVMAYTLYGCRRSGSLAIELALAEIGVDCKFIDVDLNANAQRDDRYAAVNPQRKLPTVITADGETLTESAAILLTLDERHPKAGLLPPAASAARAQALKMLMFVATEIYPLVEINDYPERFTPDGQNSDAVRERVRAIWRERWLRVEQQIAGEPWLLATGFCITDIYIAVVSRWAQQDEWRARAVPKIERLTNAVAERAACAPVWQRHQPNSMPSRFG